MPNSQWTPQEIGARLGISTAIFQRVELGARQIAEIREAGITRIELSVITGCLDYRNRHQVSEIRNECRKQGVTVVSVHGPFKLPYGSEEEAVRKTVVEESLVAIRFAEEIGATIYVAHFGFREHSKKTVTELLHRLEGSEIKLTTENQGGQKLDPYMAIVDEIGSDRFGMIVDIGHTRDSDRINPFVRADRARRTLTGCRDRLFHVHLHESFNLEQHPDHRPPLHTDGVIEWGEIFAALKEIDYSGDLIFEDGRGENPEEWIRMTAEFPQTFVRRYGRE